MQNIARAAFIILFIFIIFAIATSQSRLYTHAKTALPWNAPQTSAALVIPPSPTVVAQNIPQASAIQNAPVANSVVVTEVSAQDIAREIAEHEKDREILRQIERDVGHLAASSFAQNYLMIFQAIIYFLTLIILYSLLETVRKFASAAHASAQAALVSAEAASKATENAHGGKRHRRDVNKFIMRRLRGNWHKR